MARVRALGSLEARRVRSYLVHQGDEGRLARSDLGGGSEGREVGLGGSPGAIRLSPGRLDPVAEAVRVCEGGGRRGGRRGGREDDDVRILVGF